jgi:hypothetical protein
MKNIKGKGGENVNPMKSLKEVYRGKKDTSISSKEFGKQVPKIGVSP